MVLSLLLHCPLSRLVCCPLHRSSISFDGTAWREFQPLHSALDAADPDVVFPSPIKGQAKVRRPQSSHTVRLIAFTGGPNVRLTAIRLGARRQRQKSHQATAGQDADQDAVAARVCGEGGGLLVVHGLPGSGKTHALVGAATAASTTNRSRMLICCDTDVDADRFTLQLLSARGTGKRRPSVFRLFHPHAIQVGRGTRLARVLHGFLFSSQQPPFCFMADAGPPAARGAEV